MNRTRVGVTCALALVVVGVTPLPATSDDETVTWQQVRAALAAAHGRPGTPASPAAPPATAPEPPAGAGSATVTVTVTIPDLSWAIDDAGADPGVRRAACHQVTRLDDETAAPLAACLAHVRDDGRELTTPG